MLSDEHSVISTTPYGALSFQVLLCYACFRCLLHWCTGYRSFPVNELWHVCETWSLSGSSLPIASWGVQSDDPRGGSLHLWQFGFLCGEPLRGLCPGHAGERSVLLASWASTHWYRRETMEQLILYFNLVEPQCPDFRSNINLDISLRVFFNEVNI